MKENVKKLLKKLKSFLSGDVFKVILIGLSIGVAGIACFWGYVMTVFTNDLVEKVKMLEDENAYLKEDIRECGIDAYYYSMLYDEAEEALFQCQENYENE
ncbi:MAG: hypothetical protein IKP07_04295 [Bacilli bacterium]|nr:hypothetical protein [Bacilli bacterium]